MQREAARRLDEPPGAAVDASASTEPAPDPPTRWVRETAFGTWFVGTKVWRHQVIRYALLDLQRLLPPGHRFPVVVDFGCGAGRALRLLDIAFRPDRMIGVDVDRVQVAAAVPEARRCRAAVSLRVADAARLPLPAGVADMLFCHQTFHHLSDQDAAIREVHRVLRPGGTLLFAESCRRYIRSLPIRLLFRHPMRVQKTAGQYLALLRRAGFAVRPEAVSTPYPWWSRPDVGLLEWLGRPVSAPREPTLLNVVAVRRPDA
jgi:SAM-dependent methyltransferase